MPLSVTNGDVPEMERAEVEKNKKTFMSLPEEVQRMIMKLVS